MTKTPMIIGNWKMYKTIPETKAFIQSLVKLMNGDDIIVGLSVPYTSLCSAKEMARGSEILIGAQDVSEHKEGPYTGDISVAQLKDAGATFVLIGHSERRIHHKETNAMVKNKIQQALQGGLKPIVCIGETLEERQSGLMEDVLKKQLVEALTGLSAHEATELAVAYEPVWAIGTGKTATPQMAQEVHAFCRKCLAGIWGDLVAFSIHLLYGGSVKVDNVTELMKERDIDGVLVGGASLNAEEFSRLINLSKG